MERLRELRIKRGMTQRQLGAASGIDPVTISLIENGHRSPNLDTLEKLTGALGYEMGDLFPKAEPSLFEFYGAAAATGEVETVRLAHETPRWDPSGAAVGREDAAAFLAMLPSTFEEKPTAELVRATFDRLVDRLRLAGAGAGEIARVQAARVAALRELEAG